MIELVFTAAVLCAVAWAAYRAGDANARYQILLEQHERKRTHEDAAREIA